MSREQDVFGRAVEIDDPAERRGYVIGACGDDGGLLGRVERLIAAFSEAEDVEFLPGALVDRSAPVREGEGSVIGRYKLLQKIGEGGFGVVYMADQTEPVKRRVALKIIKLGMDTKQVVGRFEAERQALALMDHPNIAKVLDAGSTDSGRPYFVMELVRGVPLMVFCDEQKLTTAARIDVFLDICGAIEHAHQKGIIHRDLKPSNVIVTLHNDKPVPKVIDFGIAKATQQELTDKTLFTRYEDFVGTPAYMSPEQAQYSGLDIDTRSDVYSLGVMLYELLAGRPPFDSKELLGSGLEELRRRIREVEPKRPSTHVSSLEVPMQTQIASARRVEPAGLSRALRGELDWIVMRAMEKERERRYPSVSALGADLRRYLAGDVVEACPPGLGYRFRKLLRKNRIEIGVAGAVVAALGLGVIGSLWQASRAADAEDEARHQLRNALVQQARLNRGTQKTGQRYETLEIIRKAAEIEPSEPLRNEAIAAMVMPDFRLMKAFEAVDPEVIGERAWTDHSQLLARPDGRVCEYDAAGALLRELAHPAVVDFLQFSPNKDLLVTAFTDPGSRKRTVRLWRSVGADGPPLLELVGVSATSFSRGGDRLVAATQAGQIQIYDTVTGVIEREFAAPFVPNRAEMSPDAGRVAISSIHSSVACVFDVSSGERLFDLDHGVLPRAGSVFEISWSADGAFLATGGSDFVAYLWSASDGAYVRDFRGHRAEVVGADFHPGGRFLFTTSWDGTTRVWDYRTGTFLLEGAGYSAVAADGRRMEVSARSSQAGTWEFDSGAGWFSHYRLSGAVEDKAVGLSFSPDSRWLVAAVRAEVAVWETGSHERIASGAGVTGNSPVIAFEPSGTELLALDAAGVRRWALRTEVGADGVKRFEFLPREVVVGGEISHFALSRDGTTVATVQGTEVAVAGLTNGERLATLKGPYGMKSVEFGPTGQELVASCWRGRGVRVWDLARPELEPKDLLETEWVTEARFSSDGQWLAASGAIGGLATWRTGTWLPGGLVGEGGEPLALLGADPAGCYLFATRGDGEVQIIDFETRAAVAELRPPMAAAPKGAVVSPDGRYLAVSTEHRDIFVWDLVAMRAELAGLGLDWE